jgi:hypothetical protein
LAGLHAGGEARTGARADALGGAKASDRSRGSGATERCGWSRGCREGAARGKGRRWRDGRGGGRGRERGGRLGERAAGATCAQTGAVVFFHGEDEVADVDFVGVFDDVGSGDFASVDVGAVGAFEINDDELAVFDHDAGVAFGDVPFG